MKKADRKTVRATLDQLTATPIERGNLASRRPSDRDIARAAADDPDAPLLTTAQLAGGRSSLPDGKVAVSLRIDRAVLEAYKATGKGWQTRMNDALAASMPDYPGEAAETIRALEQAVQSVTFLIRELKRDVPSSSASGEDYSAAPVGRQKVFERPQRRDQKRRE